MGNASSGATGGAARVFALGESGAEGEVPRGLRGARELVFGTLPLLRAQGGKETLFGLFCLC